MRHGCRRVTQAELSGQVVRVVRPPGLHSVSGNLFRNLDIPIQQFAPFRGSMVARLSKLDRIREPVLAAHPVQFLHQRSIVDCEKA